MAARNDDSMLFVVEWYDPLPMMKRQYLLKFFVDQHMVEMVDLKSRKMFLRKSPCPNEITKQDFYVGAKINLYSRDLEIVDYGDLKTKEKLHHQVQHCVVVLTQATYADWGKIIARLTESLALIKVRSMLISHNLADRVCSALTLNARKAAAELTEGLSVALMLHGGDGFSVVQAVNDAFGM
jgi:nucleoside-diphosphate kinase